MTRRSNVGLFVGFHVGKSCAPDKREGFRISSLEAKCRVCQVPMTVERPQELRIAKNCPRIAANLFIALDLNDVRS